MKHLLTVLAAVLLSGNAFPRERFAHVFVALCDNEHQGIVPVPKKIGNGNDPDNNLYWGCGYGVRTYLKNSAGWKCVAVIKDPRRFILERCVFRNAAFNTILVADAYKGDRMKDCVYDFLECASGNYADTIAFAEAGKNDTLRGGNEDLVSFVGHNGLMDYQFAKYPEARGSKKRDVMIFCCISKSYFADAIRQGGGNPLLWTTGLCSPEAYSLRAALDGWMRSETGLQVRERAAQAYDQYIHCGIKGARGLFTTGF